jgi:Ricin-type beta-trefoil lectin domain
MPKPRLLRFSEPAHSFLAVAALGLAVGLLTGGCVDDPEADLGSDEAALSGWRWGYQRGIVSVARAGDARRYAALPLGLDRVVTHRAWTEGRALADLTVEVRDIDGHVSVRPVQWVQPLLDGTSVVLITRGDTAPWFEVDRARTAAQLVGREIRCTGYVEDQTNHQWVHAFVRVRITGGSDAALDLASVVGNVNPTTDRGTPCYDINPATISAIGYVIDVGGTPKLRRYSSLDADLARFAPLLAHGASVDPSPAVKVTTQYLLGAPTIGLAPVDNCLDVADASTTPGATVNYYPCHGAANQRFVVERVAAGQQPRLLAAQSGLCLTAGAAGAGVTLDTCGAGAAQRWRLDPWAARSLGVSYLRLSPMSALSTCVGVRDWSRAAVRPAYTPTCPTVSEVAALTATAAYDTRWLLVR